MQPCELLTATRRLLALKRWLNFGTAILLASASAAAIFAVLWAVGLANSWLVLTAAGSAALIAAGLCYRRRPQIAEAALFLDLRCGLQERMSAFVAPGRSMLLPILAADLAQRTRTIVPRQAVGQLMPDHATLLAAPLAILAAIILLAAVPSASPPASPAKGQSGQPNPPANRLAMLWRNLQEAKRRYEATRSEADRLALAQAQKAWEEEMARWQKTARTTAAGRRQTAAGANAENAMDVAAKGEIQLLRVAERMAGERLPRGGEATAAQAGPDWRVFASVEDSVPLAWRSGLRAYFDAIAAEALQRESSKAQKEGQR